MRYLKKYESHENIHSICRDYRIRNYIINEDDSIDVNSDVNLSTRGMRLSVLPIKFRNISGSFDCGYNELISLKDCPKSVGQGFYCSCNKLTSLVGCPESIGGNFACYRNELTSLEGCPKSVNINLYCEYNKLTNLEGIPKYIGGDFYCRDNRIETFQGSDFVQIGGNFYCEHNPIYEIWRLFRDHTKFEFFNDCDIIRENRVIILDRLNFFLDYIGKDTVTEVKGYKCI